MFYVPDSHSFPRNKLSIKLINKLEEKFKSKKYSIQQAQVTSNSRSLVKRFKTFSGDVQSPPKISLSLKPKKHTGVMLPEISEKKFLLKGKVTGQFQERSKSTRKVEMIQSSPRKYLYQAKKKKKRTERILEDFFSLRPWQDSKVDQY